MVQHLAILGVAFIFIVVGLTNRKRGKGPWMMFLLGGVAMTVMEILNLLGVVRM